MAWPSLIWGSFIWTTCIQDMQHGHAWVQNVQNDHANDRHVMMLALCFAHDSDGHVP